LLLMFLGVGCASARAVRMETGEGPALVFSPRDVAAEPIALEKEEFQAGLSALSRGIQPSANPRQAAEQLFEVEARSGSFAFSPRTRRLTPLEDTALVMDTDAELT